ncbi:serine/threonine protein kinase (plasmid) [Halarchaeum sp. CBA1220]|uniref:serine/threonine protein kinase n=1 Tax=Halarchaeum sp. CBA1220 TaxID=1853682 RepID=UPI000F3A852B|nr:serine/threonine-protein kinase [Halarchaeum sp. CBA1220]QLC35577.1 serine/threonine protein kinase [Halarchaeum sp. CBA1220]
MHEIDTQTLEHEAVVGRTSTTVVHRASATGVDRSVAVKHPARHGTLSNDVIQRFQNEAEQWARLDDHPNVVDVVGWGFDTLPWLRDGAPLPWIAMEYLDGGDLRSSQGAIDVDRGLWTAKRVSDAIWHAHGYGVVHLDLKPQNVLFESRSDEWDVPKVADWELSRSLLEGSDDVGVTTPRYSAPEQVREGVSDKRTDQFQLGVVLYELFTGEYPFVSDPTSVPEKTLTDAIVEADPTPPSEVDPTLPEALDDVLLRALANDPDDRYEAVLDLRRAFDALEGRVADSDAAASDGVSERIVPGTGLGITDEAGTDSGHEVRDDEGESAVDEAENEPSESDASASAATTADSENEAGEADATVGSDEVAASDTRVASDTTAASEPAASSGMTTDANPSGTPVDSATPDESAVVTSTRDADESSADAGWFTPSAYPEVSRRGLAAAIRAEEERPDASSIKDGLERAVERQSLSSALAKFEED